MTDNDIIKAFRLCHRQNGTVPCLECPYYLVDTDECIGDNNTDILDLIARQKAENEELISKLDELESEYTFYKISAQEQIEALIAGQETLQKALNEKIAEIERLGKEHCEWKSAAITNAQAMFTIKTKAVKELAERLKEKIDCDVHTSEDFYFMIYNAIDNLTKEMVGETE